MFKRVTKIVRSNQKYFSSQIGVWKEISIPVPWGEITGKWWGPTHIKPIICTHGMQDNCGTFDRLIPYLNKDENTSFLAIDFPGHGYSSPLPKGNLYDFITYPIFLRRIVDYFNWDEIRLMGHSMGAMISFAFALLYPERVKLLICIDALGPLQTKLSVDVIRATIEQSLKYEKLVDKEPLTYTFEEMVDRLSKAKNSIRPEFAHYILQRNITPSPTDPGKYYFHRHPMTKLKILFHWSQDEVLDGIKNLTRPLLYLKSLSKSGIPSAPYKHQPYHQKVLDELLKRNKYFEMHTINGTHHAHLNDPEQVGALIKVFLNKYHSTEVMNLYQETLIFNKKK